LTAIFLTSGGTASESKRALFREHEIYATPCS